jgi:ABC-2 type transport system permease protein
MHAFTRLVRSEIRLYLRDPVTVFFSVFFPSVLVGILGCIPAFRESGPDTHGYRMIDLYVQIGIVLVLAVMGLQFTPAVLATYRERGVLRRLATTPAGPHRLLAAQLVTSLAAAVVSALLVLAVGRIAFGVPLPGNPAYLLVAFLLAAGGVFAIGLLVAALAPSGKAGNAIGTLLFFPSMFFAGLWTPREVMPAVVQRIGDYTPLGAGERAVHDAATGVWPHTLSLVVLVGYLAVFGLAAARLFRWE